VRPPVEEPGRDLQDLRAPAVRPRDRFDLASGQAEMARTSPWPGPMYCARCDADCDPRRKQGDLPAWPDLSSASRAGGRPSPNR
jgi:hypothetical protein